MTRSGIRKPGRHKKTKTKKNKKKTSFEIYRLHTYHQTLLRVEVKPASRLDFVLKRIQYCLGYNKYAQHVHTARAAASVLAPFGL